MVVFQSDDKSHKKVSIVHNRKLALIQLDFISSTQDLLKLFGVLNNLTILRQKPFIPKQILISKSYTYHICKI